MSIWVFLWLLVSIALLSFLGWSLFVLHQQKRTWKAFAEQHKLRYKKNDLMESPEMSGVIDDYKMSYFTGEHPTSDGRGFRKLTAIEVNMNSILPIDGGAASGAMVMFMKALDFPAEIKPEDKAWDDDYVIVGSNRFALDAYMTDERVGILAKLMGLKNCSTIFIFKEDRSLLRVDCATPITELDYMEKLSKLMIKAARILELKNGEFKRLEAESTRKEVIDTSLKLDEEDVAASTELVLEDDDDDDVAGTQVQGGDDVLDRAAALLDDDGDGKPPVKPVRKAPPKREK